MQSIPVLRPDLLSFPMDHFPALVAYLAPLVGVIFGIFTAVLRSLNGSRVSTLVIVLVSLAVSAMSSIDQFGMPTVILFNGMAVIDDYSRFFNVLFSMSGFFTLLGSVKYLEEEKLHYPEYHLLVLFSVMGMMWMTSSAEMITLFIGLEIMSLTVYSLVGFRRADRRSNEAAMKYFVLGAVASAVLLYGAALVYGATGSTRIHDILSAIQTQPLLMTPLFVLGLGLILCGFLFKVAAVPFHMWMPDVYEGAPSPVTGFMTTGIKAASFAIFLRVLISMGFGKAFSDQVSTHFHQVLWVLSVLTMLIGNLIALTQTNLKRMLAYSSIAHTGYILVGFIAGSHSEQGYAPILIYLVSYVVMNLGAFTILTMISSKQDSAMNLHDLSGLSQKHPVLALCMSIFMLSMAGIPPMGGFLAKYLLFYGAIQSGEVLLPVLAVLCSAISVYYYLRVLVYMYMREPVGNTGEAGRISIMSAFAVFVMVLITFQLGIMPSILLNLAKRAVTGF